MKKSKNSLSKLNNVNTYFILTLLLFTIILGYFFINKNNNSQLKTLNNTTVTGTIRHLYSHILESDEVVSEDIIIADNKVQKISSNKDLSEYTNQNVQIMGKKSKNTIEVASINKQEIPKITSIQETYAQIKVGEIKPLILLVNFTDNTSKPFDTSTVYKNMFTSNTSVKDYFAENSFGKVKITGDASSVMGWYTLDISSKKCSPQWFFDVAEKALTVADKNNISTEDYNSYIFVFPRNSACSTNLNGTNYTTEGTSVLGDKYIWMNGNINPRPIAHEMLHTMGLGHAHKCGNNACTSINATGDRSDIMGIYLNTPPSHLSAGFKLNLKWIPNRAPYTIQIDKPGVYKDIPISPIEDDVLKTQAIRIPIYPPYYTSDYMITYRVGKNNNFDQLAGIENGVYIHEYNPHYSDNGFDSAAPATILKGMLTTGNKTFNDPEKKITISLSSMDSSIAKVTINYGQSDIPPASPSPSSASNKDYLYTAGSCSGLGAKNMLSLAVPYCYGHATDKNNCTVLSQALDESYVPANLCEQKKSLCTNGTSSEICKAAAKYQEVTDWCYNITKNNESEAERSGVNAKWCDTFSIVTNDAHLECNSCSDKAGPTTTPVPFVKVGGFIWDTNGQGVGGVPVAITKYYPPIGREKTFSPTTAPNGNFSQGDFIVKEDIYRVEPPNTLGAKTTTDQYAKNYNNNKNETKIGSPSYLGQKAGFWDCGSYYNSADQRCIFVVKKPFNLPGGARVKDVTTFIWGTRNRSYQRYLRRSFLSFDGKTVFSTNCYFDANIFVPHDCTPYTTSTITDIPTPVLGYDVTLDSNTTIKQHYVLSDGNTLVTRTCRWDNSKGTVITNSCGTTSSTLINAPSKVSGIAVFSMYGKTRYSYISSDGKNMHFTNCTYNTLTGCTGFTTIANGVPGGATGYGAFAYNYGSTNQIQQLFSSADGKQPAWRTCKATSLTSVQCPSFW